MIVNSSEVFNELSELGCQAVQPPNDLLLFCPSLAWLDGFCKWFLTHPDSRHVVERWDCEDITRAFIYHASKALVDSVAISDAVGHTIGFAKVTLSTWLEDGEESKGLNGIMPAPPATHMTAIGKFNDGEYYFIEPQTGQKTNAKTAIDRGIVGAFLWAWV